MLCCVVKHVAYPCVSTRSLCGHALIQIHVPTHAHTHEYTHTHTRMYAHTHTLAKSLLYVHTYKGVYSHNSADLDIGKNNDSNYTYLQ